MKKLEQYGAYILPTGEQAVFFSADDEFCGYVGYEGAEVGTLDCTMIDPEYEHLFQKGTAFNQREAFGLCAIHDGDWAGRYAIDKGGEVRRLVFTGKAEVDLFGDDQAILYHARDQEITINHPALYVALPEGQRMVFDVKTRVDDKVLFRVDALVLRGDISALLEGIDL